MNILTTDFEFSEFFFACSFYLRDLKNVEAILHFRPTDKFGLIGAY